MKLVEGGWKKELVQCWKNAASVLDALQGSLQDILGIVIYIHSADITSNPNTAWQEVDKICREQIKSNGGILAGQVDERTSSADDYGGYEDYETWKEMEINQQEDSNDGNDNPKNYLAVALPQMPKGALAEVELICATSKASACLDIAHTSSWLIEGSDSEMELRHDTNPFQINWDIGNNTSKMSSTNIRQSPIRVESVISSLGKGCTAVVNTVAFLRETIENSLITMQPIYLIQDMIHSSLKMLTTTAGIDLHQILHVRVFVTKASYESGLDDQSIRMALCSVLSAECSACLARQTISKLNTQGKVNLSHSPAFSIVPVDEIYLSPIPDDICAQESKAALGMQVIAADLVHLESEMWIHHNRSYN